jgi:hypothetical protein
MRPITIPAVLFLAACAGSITIPEDTATPNSGCDTDEEVLETADTTPHPSDTGAEEVEPWTLTGDLTIENDLDLRGLEGLIAINGDLTIRNVGGLRSLRDLKAIQGKLTIEDTRLITLEDLASLEGAQEVALMGNDFLETMQALDQTVSVERILLADNPQLRAVAVGYVRDLYSISITGNDLLTDLGSLEDVEVVQEVSVVGNRSLCQAYALTELAWVAEDFYIIEDNGGACL